MKSKNERIRGKREGFLRLKEGMLILKKYKKIFKSC